MDMAILVETQGDLIDQIEFSVMNSKAFTEKAVETLQQTEKIVINTRKVGLPPRSSWLLAHVLTTFLFSSQLQKKVCIVITVILIIALVVIVIAVISGVIPPIVSKA
jgi:hypothetical protein